MLLSSRLERVHDDRSATQMTFANTAPVASTEVRIDTYCGLRGLSVRLEPVRTLTMIPLRNRLMAWGYKHADETWTLPYIRTADEGPESLAVKRQNPRPQNDL